MRTFLYACLLGLAISVLQVACSFSVDRPDQFSTVDSRITQDLQVDVGTPDVVAEDLGSDAPPPECVNDGDCPEAEGQCFAARCTAGKCSNEPDKGGDCEDGDKCTEGDKCNINGQCLPGTNKKCSPSSDPCVEMVCNPENGACQESYIEGCVACLEHGDSFVVGEGECCDDKLWEVPDCLALPNCEMGDECCVCEGPMLLCLHCGDGKCEPPEDYCNCAEDCGGPLGNCFESGGDCYAEICPPNAFEIPGTFGCDEGLVCCAGETQPCLLPGETGFPEEGAECCPELQAIPIAEAGDENCKFDESMFVCSPCGDGVCQGQWSENVCSCPQDCVDGGCESDEECLDGKNCVKGECKYCGAIEVCNNYDDDCDGVVDDDCETTNMAEICGDELDNDDDGTVDEAVCVKDLCPGVLPPFYLKAPLHKLANDPGGFAGQPVAVSGRATHGEGGCLGVPACIWDLNLEEQGVKPDMITVGPSEQYKEVYCISDNAVPVPEVCMPLAKNKTYIVWGLWDKDSQSPEGGFVLSLHGFCQP